MTAPQLRHDSNTDSSSVDVGGRFAMVLIGLLEIAKGVHRLVRLTVARRRTEEEAANRRERRVRSVEMGGCMRRLST
jgi:hypothetical protein